MLQKRQGQSFFPPTRAYSNVRYPTGASAISYIVPAERCSDDFIAIDFQEA